MSNRAATLPARIIDGKTHEIKFYDKIQRQILWLAVYLNPERETEDLNAFVQALTKKPWGYGFRTYRKLTPNRKYQPQEIIL